MNREVVDSPTPVKHGLTFWPIPEVSDPEMLFGSNRYFDRYSRPHVPREWEDKANDLFFSGGKPQLDKQVDKEKAYRFIHALLCSFAPAHEAKITTVAYALWLYNTPEALVQADVNPRE